MNTVGEVIRTARVRKKISRRKLSGKTKIKEEFIKAIEENDWKKLPEFPVVRGFTKNIAKSLSLGDQRVLALLRRDYLRPAKSMPNPDVERKPFWTPKHTFVAGAFAVLIAIFAYLGYQYINFVRPPSLEVVLPPEGQKIDETTLVVSGKTDADVSLTANNQPILIGEGGDFVAKLNVNPDTKEIVFVATSRSGKKTVVARNIIVEQAR